jgi:hypothetical protein
MNSVFGTIEHTYVFLHSRHLESALRRDVYAIAIRWL